MAGRERIDRLRPIALLVGPVPPPTFGQAIGMRILLDSPDLGEHYALLHINTNNVGRSAVQKTLCTLWSLYQYVWMLGVHRPRLVYLSISRSRLGCIKDCIMMVLARLCGTPCVVHLRGGDLTAFYEGLDRVSKHLVRWAYRDVSVGIVLGESLQSQFRDLLRSDRVRVILNCWHDGESEALPYRAERPSGAPLRLAFISNVLPSKGIYEALEGVAWAVQRGVKLEFRFAGQFLDHDGAIAKLPQLAQENLSARELEDKYHKLVEALGLANHIVRMGTVTEQGKWKLLAETDILLLPIYNPTEGQPLVAIEAMRAGCAIISTSCGGLADIVKDGVTGRVVPPRNPVEVGGAIQWFWDHPAELGKIGKDNAERAVRAHSPNEHVRHIRKIFDEVLSIRGTK